MGANRQFFLDLAGRGQRMPIGTDLVLREKPGHEQIVRDGRRLAQVIIQAAERYHTPLAIGLMDLTLEKERLIELLGIDVVDPGGFHFGAVPEPAAVSRFLEHVDGPLNVRTQAAVNAVAQVAEQNRLFPTGMTIGPFSLMTKLIADPITPVFDAGAGLTAGEEPQIALVEQMLELSERVIKASVAAQLRAGAKAIFVAEPAANIAYISPRQLAEGATHWERYIMQPNRRLRAQIETAGAELIFHCCGELCDEMVTQFGTLQPAMLSLGSSRTLWQDAALVPRDTVLFGNLPTKRFYSDAAITTEQVRGLTRDLSREMKRTGHPFILGSECDVLWVDGSEQSIRSKVDVMLTCN